MPEKFGNMQNKTKQKKKPKQTAFQTKIKGEKVR